MTTNTRRLPIIGNMRKAFFQSLERAEARKQAPGVFDWFNIAALAVSGGVFFAGLAAFLFVLHLIVEAF